EAQIAKTQLEAFGIPARIENEHTINMDWFYSNALGGVRLLVLEKDVHDAKAFLEKDFSEDLEQEFGKNKERCPNCGSYDIEAYTKGKKSAFMAFMFFGLPLFSFKNGNRCKQCQYFWS
ncbi:putative signal transducing protein, partial [Acinetobacter seifertii]